MKKTCELSRWTKEKEKQKQRQNKLRENKMAKKRNSYLVLFHIST
jgi:hypothetical protein